MRLIYVIIASVVLFTSCEEDIDISVGSESSKLVIDGSICDIETEWNYVRLSKSTNYFSNAVAPEVSGASVIVNDGEVDIEFKEGDKKGYYMAPKGFKGEHGRTYSLTVKADTDGDGKPELFTASEPMPPTYELDSVKCSKLSVADYFQIKLYAEEDINTRNFYMFGMFYKDELVSDRVTSHAWTDDDLFTEEYCWGATVFAFGPDDIDNYEITPGDEITFYAMSINEDYYIYLNAVSDIVSGGTPMFSSAPANAVGNITGDAYGFFNVFAIVDAKCTVSD